MLAAAIPQTFNSREEMVRAVLEIKVPGYGANGNTLSQPDGSIIHLWCIEIPGRGKDRGLVFREAGGKLVKLDDFVYDSDRDADLSDVRSDGDRLFLRGFVRTASLGDPDWTEVNWRGFLPRWC